MCLGGFMVQSLPDAPELFANDDFETVSEGLAKNKQAILFESDRHQNNRLHYYSMRGDVAMVRLLLEACSDAERKEYVNMKNDFGMIALHFAALNGHFEVVKILAEAGSDMLAEDKAGNIPFTLARKANPSNSSQIVHLLERGLIERCKQAERAILEIKGRLDENKRQEDRQKIQLAFPPGERPPSNGQPPQSKKRRATI